MFCITFVFRRLIPGKLEAEFSIPLAPLPPFLAQEKKTLAGSRNRRRADHWLLPPPKKQLTTEIGQ